MIYEMRDHSTCNSYEKKDSPKRHMERNEDGVYGQQQMEREGNINTQKPVDEYRKETYDKVSELE